MARRCLSGNPPITNWHGRVGWGHFNKHLGYDYGVGIGTPVFATQNGVIRMLSTGSSGGNIIELDSGTYWHRFLHLNRFHVRNGQQIVEGQHIADSGATGNVSGPHVHHDTRKAGTLWNASFDNYIDWEAFIKPKQMVMPPVGSKVQLIPVDTRTTFKAGTTIAIGSIRVTDNSFIYTVRGIDPKYPNRILINSKSAGGDGVSLALYYTSGAKIPNWKQV